MKFCLSALGSSFLGSIFASSATIFRNGFFLIALLFLPALSTGQTFVQENNNLIVVNASTVSVTYAAAETAGNTNIVIVGWGDTSSSVVSVVDDNNNIYRLVGTTAGNGITQGIYYAANIALPTNNTPTVTVTLNQNAGFPDVRILEYSGLSATSPLDNWTGGTGVSTSANSGATTTSTNDLIVGAGTTGGTFTAAGVGFISRAITAGFGDIVEDSNATVAAGAHNATATLLAGSTWVMQVAGFSTTPVNYAPPTISPTTPITPTSGPDVGGTSVTVTGTGFQPGAVVLFGTAPGGISGVNCVESAGTTITCLTPSDGAGMKDVTVVNVDGQSSSAAAAYNDLNVAPTFSSIAPTSGVTNGSAVTITGTNFQVGAAVTIDGLPAGDIVVLDPTAITANTPANPVGAVAVKVKNPDGGTVTSAGAYTYTLGTGPINFIQRGGSATLASTASVVSSMPGLQIAGNLNVVIIGWSDTVAHVSSVVDTEGNVYVAALPATNGNALSQAIYYAKNIVGDPGPTPNQVTVTFDQAAVAPDVRVVEYAGLDTANPLDAVASNVGSGTISDSGACTTTTAVELILAGITVGGAATGPGQGFNLVDLTVPNGDSDEHQITAAAGSCEATAPLTGSDWVTQVVTFKTTPGPVADFSLSALPASQTVVAGSPASYTVSVTPSNTFSNPVALSCLSVSLPTGASCAFAPTPVTPGAAAVTSALTISTSASTPAGISTVTVAGTFGSISGTTTVGLTVNAAPPADFTIAASALSPASVAAGGTATSTITIAPVGAFSAAVDLTCAVTPAVTRPPTCSLNPTSVAGGSGTSTLTVSTTAATTAQLVPQSRGVFYAMLLPIAGLALLGTGFNSRRKLFAFLLGCLLFSGLIFMAACGGSSSSGGGGGGGHPGTPAGTYSVTVTGTATGSLTHSQTVTLMVN